MNRAERVVLSAAMMILWVGPALSAQPSFELDLQELDAARKNAPKSPAKKPLPAPKPKPAPLPPATTQESAGVSHYTVKPGDHIFKILMRDFRLSNAEAERLLPEIVRLNQLSDIRRLAVGQTVLIPGHLAAAVKTRPAKAPPVVVMPAAETVTPVGAPETAPVAAAPEVKAPPPVPAAATAAAPEQAGTSAVPSAVVPVTPQTAAQSAPPAMVPVGTVLAVTINGGDPLSVFLRLADVLQMRVQPNQVIASHEGTADSFSIKVPLYAEAQGKRLVVTSDGQDPFQYTLFRLLESEGYGVLQFRDGDGFREVTAATLTKLGLAAQYGRFRLINGQEQEVLGYLLTAQGGKMLLTDAPVGGVWTALEVGGQ